jgi:hypothetical protein
MSVAQPKIKEPTQATMAQIRQFHCPKCNYHAEVSGGEDRGLDIYTQTIICHECKELHDVPAKKFSLPDDSDRIQPDPHAKPLVAAWVKFRIGEAGRAANSSQNPSQFSHLQHYWKPVKLSCPESPFHRVDKWFGMHLPLVEDAGTEQANVDSSARGGACPRCGTTMLRSQPMATWE